METVYVVKGNLLGLPVIQALCILTHEHTVKQSIIDQYSSLFTGLGTFKDGYLIKLKPDPRPFSCLPIEMSPPTTEEGS